MTTRRRRLSASVQPPLESAPAAPARRAARKKPSTSGTPIEWTARAVADLREIDEYIASDDPIAAERWYRIVYRVREKGILMLTIFEGHRLFPPGASGSDIE